MLNPNLIDAFKFWRIQARTRTAEMALFNARKDIANGTKRYPATRGGMRGGADWKLGSESVFWCECPDAYLRRVGFADQCGARSVQHTGWYMSDDNWTGEKARGVVFQLTGRDGEPRFISGIADANNDNASVLSLELFGDKGDAARNADALAELYADNARDYQRAWQAGQDYRELSDTIAETRRNVAAILKARRDHIRNADKVPTILTVLECKARELIGDILDARTKRKTLWREYGMRAGFCD